MHIQAVHQGYVVVLRDQIGQQKLFQHSRLHFSHRGSKYVFFRCKDESQEQLSVQTNKPRMLSLCMTLKKNSHK